ncbi:unnamed protein product [Gongylonema pulchrum]|uniref:Uncharacterized protein n=1 Tax=Gongylonema pulchrum TaxID=637853 RepID=A0A183D913_9BILA|nr:unnamed protein product [Gongylonema pulchrum]
MLVLENQKLQLQNLNLKSENNQLKSAVQEVDVNWANVGILPEEPDDFFDDDVGTTSLPKSGKTDVQIAGNSDYKFLPDSTDATTEAVSLTALEKSIKQASVTALPAMNGILRSSIYSASSVPSRSKSDWDIFKKGLKKVFSLRKTKSMK